MLQTRLKQFIDSLHEGLGAGFVAGVVILFLILLNCFLFVLGMLRARMPLNPTLASLCSLDSRARCLVTSRRY